jgi:uncharacterized protein (TIGR02246 family)
MFLRYWIAIAAAFVILGGPAASQDTPDAAVRAAITETLSAWTAGDFERLAQFYRPDARGFLFGGGPLARGFNAVALQAAYETGFRAAFQVRGLDIKVLGDAALAVAYLDGTLTMPGGEQESGSWRYSETRVRDGEHWQIVQYHFSKAMTPTR